MDSINITGLSATGFHGVFPEERRNGQLFVVDVELGVQLETRSDEISDTVDYVGIADLIRAEIEGEPCRLIETLAGRIAGPAGSCDGAQTAGPRTSRIVRSVSHHHQEQP